MLLVRDALRLSAAIFIGALVAAAYWPGLAGPFLLDDFGNLADVGAWLDGERSWKSAILNNRSGPSGRPLSMATFVLDAMLWGKSTWHFKLTNLLIHLLSGLLLWCLYARLTARDPSLARYRWLPIVLAATWLALPIHASSVLYVVQRMAMLSAACMIGALWLYVDARERIERSERSGHIMLWLALPALTTIGFFFKENAILVPLMAAVIELGYFRPQNNKARPSSVKSFFALSIGLPAATLLLTIPAVLHWLDRAYAHREFSLLERVLTQPRALWDYASSIVVPYGPRLGLFHDNYPVSESIFTPWTTLPAMVAWAALVITGWRLRDKYPSIFAGVLLFLTSHAMESTVVALELYFEHRNYLPSIGIVLMIAGLISAASDVIPRPTREFKTTIKILAAGLFLIYMAATHSRAIVWSSLDTLYAQELKFNASSPRLHSFMAGRAMEQGDLANALMHIDSAERHSPPSEHPTMSLWRALAYCAADAQPPDPIYAQVERRARGRITIYAMSAWEMLARQIETGECPAHDAKRLSDAIASWIDKSNQSGTEHPVWRTRYYLARVYAYLGNYPLAQNTADIAWRDSGFSPGIGVFLFQMSATIGDKDKATEALNQLENSYGQGDYKLDEAIIIFRDAMASGTVPPAHSR